MPWSPKAICRSESSDDWPGRVQSRRDHAGGRDIDHEPVVADALTIRVAGFLVRCIVIERAGVIGDLV